MNTKLTAILTFFVCILCWGAAGTSAEDFSLPELESGKVVLTWTDLKTLLDELDALRRSTTQDESDEKEEEPPPVDYSIAEAALRGTVNGDSVRFDADFTIHLFKKGWLTVPFFQEHVGIESLRIQPVNQQDSMGFTTLFQDKQKTSEPLAQMVRDEKGYSILAQGPGAFKIQTTFHVPIRSEHLTHTLAFLPPPAVINQITLRIPEKGVNILETEPSGQVTQTEDVTTFDTVLSKQDLIRVSWKIEKDTGISRKSSAVIHSLASVDKSVMSVSSSILLRHLNSLEQLELHLPRDVNILNVSSADIDRWTVEESEQTHVITLSGMPDRRKPVDVTLTYKKPLPPLPADVEIPALRINGIDTLEGVLGIEIQGNLDVSSRRTTKFFIPAKNLPDVLWQRSSSPLLFGYEFYDNTFNAALSLKQYQEVQTVVANVDVVDCITHRTLEGKSISSVRYFIRNNDRQFLPLTLPPNSRIWQTFLDGKPVKPAQKETGEVLIPMKKSSDQGDELQSFVIELGYIADVSKLSLKGEFVNELPEIDIPINYLRWSLYFPEDYEYTNFEGPLKQVEQFSDSSFDMDSVNAHIEIPRQGKSFRFEKYLLVDETPYIRGKYGQNLGSDIFLSMQPHNMQTLQKVTPMSRYKK